MTWEATEKGAGRVSLNTTWSRLYFISPAAGSDKRSPLSFLHSSVIPVILILALFSLLFFAGCSSSTPESVVRDFIQARLDGHEGRAADLTVEGDLSEYLGGEPFLAGSGASMKAETVEVSSDRARVIVHFRWEEGEANVSYICRRVGSRWKVALRETEEFRLPELELLREEDENT